MEDNLGQENLVGVGGGKDRAVGCMPLVQGRGLALFNREGGGN